jgi:hypothetical protein
MFLAGVVASLGLVLKEIRSALFHPAPVLLTKPSIGLLFDALLFGMRQTFKFSPGTLPAVASSSVDQATTNSSIPTP